MFKTSKIEQTTFLGIEWSNHIGSKAQYHSSNVPHESVAQWLLYEKSTHGRLRLLSLLHFGYFLLYLDYDFILLLLLLVSLLMNWYVLFCCISCVIDKYTTNLYTQPSKFIFSLVASSPPTAQVWSPVKNFSR